MFRSPREKKKYTNKTNKVKKTKKKEETELTNVSSSNIKILQMNEEVLNHKDQTNAPEKYDLQEIKSNNENEKLDNQYYRFRFQLLDPNRQDEILSVKKKQHDLKKLLEQQIQEKNRINSLKTNNNTLDEYTSSYYSELPSYQPIERPSPPAAPLYLINTPNEASKNKQNIAATLSCSNEICNSLNDQIDALRLKLDKFQTKLDDRQCLLEKYYEKEVAWYNERQRLLQENEQLRNELKSIQNSNYSSIDNSNKITFKKKQNSISTVRHHNTIEYAKIKINKLNNDDDETSNYSDRSLEEESIFLPISDSEKNQKIILQETNYEMLDHLSTNNNMKEMKKSHKKYIPPADEQFIQSRGSYYFESEQEENVKDSIIISKDIDMISETKETKNTFFPTVHTSSDLIVINKDNETNDFEVQVFTKEDYKDLIK